MVKPTGHIVNAPKMYINGYRPLLLSHKLVIANEIANQWRFAVQIIYEYKKMFGLLSSHIRNMYNPKNFICIVVPTWASCS